MLEECKPSAVFIGTPPFCHGSTQPNRDIEVQCAKRNIHIFIEKPISCSEIDDVELLGEILEEAAEKGLVISVGYIFRYSKTIKKMKELIARFGPPKAFNARYNCAYSTLSKPMWWDRNLSGGPIVEQATHFCDLARYLVGEIDLSSVHAMSIKSTDAAGHLSAIPSVVNEENIPIERRTPRVTSAMWKFKSGALGTLMHGTLMHGFKYDTELEIWGDGYQITLVDPYDQCKLIVRAPQSEESKVDEFCGDDYYYSEVKIFLEAVLSGHIQEIQSPFHDAIQTYKFTMAIRTSAETP
jgi:predicted dehydrogenase